MVSNDTPRIARGQYQLNRYPVYFDDMDMHARLKWARERQKDRFPSAAKFATSAHVGESTYRHHENGIREYDWRDAKAYARKLKVSWVWLLTGEGQPDDFAGVNVVGHIGAGGLVYPMDDHPKGAGLDIVDAPPEMGPNTVAVRVRGDSMWPVFDEGDLIYFEERAAAPERLVGELCIVAAVDGRLMLKRLQKGSQGPGYDLISLNAPPMPGVELEWAAPISWIRKRKPLMRA